MVDIQEAVADYREAVARRQESTTSNMPKRSYYVQKRLSIYNRNPGPRRDKEGGIERQITGTWHVINLQEAIAPTQHTTHHTPQHLGQPTMILQMSCSIKSVTTVMSVIFLRPYCFRINVNL